MDDPKHVRKLVDRYIRNLATDEEIDVFFSLLKQGKLDTFLEHRLNQDIDYKSTQSTFIKIKNNALDFGLKAAASVAILFVIGLVVYRLTPDKNQLFSSAKYVQISTGDREIKKVKLMDGTLVQLNRNSTLQYPREWTEAQREVQLLRGEAFFDVKRDSLRQFVVRTPGDMAVEVLGTAFNVALLPGKTSVFLQKGKVLLRQQQQALALAPGELAEYEPHHHTIRIQPADEELWLAWRNGLFVFDDARLDEIAQVLEEYYAIRIEIATPALAQQRFTGKVPRQDINLVMKVLAKTLNLRVSRQNGTLTMQPQ